MTTPPFTYVLSCVLSSCIQQIETLIISSLQRHSLFLCPPASSAPAGRLRYPGHQPSLPHISPVKGISALGTEFRRVSRILRLPSAFITTVKGRSGRSGLSAFRTEFSLVYGSAGTGPACCGTGLSALGTEFSGVHRAAATGPASGGLSGSGRAGCRSIPHLSPLGISALLIPHAAHLLRLRSI